MPTNHTIPSGVPGDDGVDIIGAQGMATAGCVFVCVLLDLTIKRFRIGHWFPESVAAVVFGLLLGVTMRLALGHESTGSFEFNADIFFYGLLPLIIFDAGYGLKKKHFFANLGSITLYAFVGTAISTFVFGLGMYYMATFDIFPACIADDDVFQWLIFGAYLSATDPVATLAIYSSKSVDAPPLMYSLVFGESVLNDAVAFVLFKALSSFQSTPFTTRAVGQLIGQFIGISLGSIGIGLTMGMLLAFITKRVRIADSHYHISFILLTGFFTYCWANFVSMSGIMALFFCAVTLTHYNFYNMPKDAAEASHITVKSLAHLCETMVFAYIGVTMALSIINSQAGGYRWDLSLLLSTLIWCLVARAANIFPLSFVLNLGRKVSIPFRMQVCMWFAGLRGACAFALSLKTPASDTRDLLVTTTLFIVLVTTILGGGLTENVVRTMRMRGADLALEELKSAESTQSVHTSSIVAPSASSAIEQLSKVASTYQSRVAERFPLEVFSDDELDPLDMTDSDIELVPRPRPRVLSRAERTGLDKLWHRLDNEYIKAWFGGRDTRTKERAESVSTNEMSLLHHQHAYESPTLPVASSMVTP